MEGFNKRQVNTLLEYLKRFENGNTQTSKTNKLEAFRNSSKCEKKWTTEKQKHITLGIRNPKNIKRNSKALMIKNQSENKR